MAVYLPMWAKSCRFFIFLVAAFSAKNATAQSLRIERAELSTGGVKVGHLSGTDVAWSRWRSKRQLDVQVKLGGTIITGTIAVAGEVWGSSDTILVAGVARPTRLLSDGGFAIDLLPSAWAEVFGHSPRGTQIRLHEFFPFDEATIPSGAPPKKRDIPAKVSCPPNLHCSCAPLALYPRPDDSTEPYRKFFAEV